MRHLLTLVWRDLVAAAFLVALLLAVLLLAPGGETECSLTREREAFLRERIEYLTAQVQLERLRCTQERAERSAEDVARMLGLEVAP